MKAGADMEIAGKAVCVLVLLTVTEVTRTGGNNSVSATVGDSSVLPCPHRPNINLVTWKISPKVGGPCALGYRADQNKTDRTNCSDSLNWKFRPDHDPALEIRQVGIAHEGNYTCEVAEKEGNFHKTYHLTVLVPPRLTLYCDNYGNPVCEAAAGKPAAHIAWLPEGNSTPKEEGHDDGTVTVLSKFRAPGINVINVGCFVSHPAMNQSKSIACHPSGNNFMLPISIILCFLIVIITAVICYFKLHTDRLCHKMKSPETAPTHSSQDDTVEVEPYTTYVQKENEIYNSVSDLTVGQNLPQGVLPAT